jgi:flagellin-specific chaperone FliS
MPRNKHNKKRNTAFLYEALLKEVTKAIISGDRKVKKTAISILKESFAPKTVLSEELELYKTLLETKEMNNLTAEKIVFQVRQARNDINEGDIVEAQNRLISRVNKELSSGVYSNFVPNYKNIATVSQLFSTDEGNANIKSGVLLEQKIVASMMEGTGTPEAPKMKPIDNLVFKSFVSKYNKEYSSGILNEQKELLNRYILSFSDNGIDVNIYLNEELGRLHSVLTGALVSAEIKTDATMVESTKRVISMIDGFRETPINKDLIEDVLKIQNLVSEIQA